MPIPKIILLLLVFSCFSTKGQPAQVIPFRLTEYNNISVKAILNKIDTVDLMVHTAANSMTLTKEAVKKLKSLRFVGNTDSIKSWGGEANSARLSLHNSLRIGSLDWHDLEINENVNSGQGTDGKFGIDLFSDWCVQIDFDSSVIRLSKNLPKSIKKYKKTKLENRDGNLFIEAELRTKNGAHKNKFLVHSGYSGALLFDDKLAQEANLNNALPIISEQKLTDSYGNIVKTKQAILPELTLAGTKLTQVPAGFFDGAIGIQQVSILGGDFAETI
jgi:hypothetical protein